ncbi:hypothetical protein [Gymnodinialimonas hymeniacidonis]|uniref:hypothetical protein n=1 Tax=Gymnodinialimonas hymeniacidonis TaxID=3126508 RepID=UPI0034C5CB0D
MHKRALLGLALFACLLASGWAWQRLAEDSVSTEYQGSFVRITVMESREALCADTPDTPPAGILRVDADRVTTVGGTCEIARINVISEDTTEGRSYTHELGLDCGGQGAGPGGVDATLWITARAEMTSYLAMDDGGYVEAHATYMRCPGVPVQ